LIETIQINEKTLLVRFGADAVTAINTKKGIVVVDAGISSGLTEKYKKIIELHFPDKNIEYVINTHGHADHYGGNSVFSGAKVVAHSASLQEMRDYQMEPNKLKMSLKQIVDEYDSALVPLQPGTDDWNEIFTQKIRYLNAYNDVADKRKTKEPDIIFSDSLTVLMDDVTLEMYFFGKSHSNSDILLFVPELNFLFTGDLFTRYGKPGFDETMIENTEKCQQSVNWIEKRMNTIEKIITGHGQLLSTEDLKSFTGKIMHPNPN
jgi:glyoxylase-like metal-dependent hydrolase (beta-lactamase superfamily II)